VKGSSWGATAVLNRSLLASDHAVVLARTACGQSKSIE
jgi:hypothetical protein